MTNLASMCYVAEFDLAVFTNLVPQEAGGLRECHLFRTVRVRQALE